MSDLALIHVNEDDIAKAEEATKVPVVNGGENSGRYSISLLFIRTVLQRVFAIMLGMEPEWVEALKLLNKLIAGAPLASVLADEDYIEVGPCAFKLGTKGAPLKSKMASYCDDDSFGEKFPVLQTSVGLRPWSCIAYLGTKACSTTRSSGSSHKNSFWQSPGLTVVIT
jgi:hypothetical protein